MLVTCDYLEIYLRGLFTPKPTKDFVFLLKDIGTKIYKAVYEVKYQGVLFGTLQTSPRMSSLPDDACHFKVENEQLYILGTNGVLVELLNQCGLVYHSVTRLDVACDFQSFSNGYKPADFVSDYISGKIERKGRGLASFSAHFAGRLLTGCSFGSRTSERFGRMYNKTLLLQKENKPYITAWHEKNGLVGADVWRLEFTLRGKEIKKLFLPRALTQAGREKMSIGVKQAISSEKVLLVQDVLSGIFLTELNSYFTFVPVTNDSNKTRRKAVELLDFSTRIAQPELILRIGIKRSAAPKNERYKRAVKTLLLDYYLTKQETYLFVALQFIEKYNLHDITRKRFPYWLKEFAPYVHDAYKYVSILDMLDTTDTCA